MSKIIEFHDAKETIEHILRELYNLSEVLGTIGLNSLEEKINYACWDIRDGLKVMVTIFDELTDGNIQEVEQIAKDIKNEQD